MNRMGAVVAGGPSSNKNGQDEKSLIHMDICPAGISKRMDTNIYYRR